MNPSYTSSLNKKVENLIEVWSSSMPNMQSDPASTWDDVISNRCLYLEFIEDKYYTEPNRTDLEMSVFEFSSISNDQEEFGNRKNILKRMEKCKWTMKIEFSRAAQYQGNFKLALNKLQQTRGITKNQSRDFSDLQVKWMHCYLNTHLARAKFANSSEDSLNIFFGALSLREILKFDDNQELLTKREFYQEQQILHANFSKFLIDSFIAIENNDKRSDFFNQFLTDDKKRAQLNDYLKTTQISDYDLVI